MHILGISAFYHDSAAALVRDGAIVAACQEERFSRVKHDWRFPVRAVDACLKEAGIGAGDLDAVVFYDKPFLKFERILETYMAVAPAGIGSFIASMPLWIKRKMWMKSLIEDALAGYKGRVLFTEHHQAHAASAFFPSPFREAAVLTADGVGEWATTSVGLGRDNRITLLKEIHFPHSLGMLYSAFTYYTGFKVNSGEYKVMGLAPYGRPVYVQKILDHLIDLKPDGSFRLNMKYFNYCAGLTMTHPRFHRLFGGPPRKPETALTQRDMDLARSVQDVVETAMLSLAAFAKKETGSDRLCLAGGVALNCVANGRILRENIFKDIWIQPASGDAGGALGAALAAWHGYHGKPREADGVRDSQSGSLLGPAPDESAIRAFLDGRGAPYRAPGEEALIRETAERLAAGKVVGWFSGRMEFGPRALGCRSILGDPRSPAMQKVMNLKIKFRESFRPFAPAVLEAEAGRYFEIDRPSPYMLLVAEVRRELRKPETEEESSLFGIDRLNVSRSVIPAVTHVDYSARLQTVNAETNPRFHALLSEFHRLTGCPVLVNTSFNVRGEPLVCSPQDAYACFMRTDMDALVLGGCLLDKAGQPAFEDDPDWRRRFALD
ncbi:MAG: carbamoyltransferase [bacterium]|nr:carbamoyltransferase [bacterium]